MPIKIRESLLATLLLATFVVPANAAVLRGIAVSGGTWDGFQFTPSGNGGSWFTYDFPTRNATLYIDTDFDGNWTTGLLNTDAPPNTIPLAGITINGPVFNARLGGDGSHPGPLNSPSDPYYALTLVDSDGGVIFAIYNTPQPTGLGIVDLLDVSDQFDLLNFTWLRPTQLGAPAIDGVSVNAPTPGDSSSDYVGLLSISVVPETSTMFLSSLSLLGLGVAAWRRNRREAYVTSRG